MTRKLLSWRVAGLGAAGLVIAGGLYMVLMGAQAKHVLTVTGTSAAAASAAAKKAASSVSTVKPTPKAVAAYTVAPTVPKYLRIASLGVDARVFSVGLTSAGAIGTPYDVFDTAWYNGSAKPGQPGATLIDGHISSWTSPGVFYRLTDLKAGDVVQVVRGDNKVFTYKVVKTVVYSSNRVDMHAALSPAVAGKNGLNLISCTGDVIPGTSEFNQRIVVFTEQV